MDVSLIGSFLHVLFVCFRSPQRVHVTERAVGLPRSRRLAAGRPRRRADFAARLSSSLIDRISS